MHIKRKIGTHYAEINDDVLFIKYQGNETEESALGLIEIMKEGFGDKSYYAVLDFAEMGQIEPKARKILGAWAADRNFLGAAIYGANMTTRALTVLVQSTIRLLGRKVIPVSYVKDAAQAYAWVDEQRKKARTKS